jgi:predicted DNA-binding protein with PD1-like motif
VGERKLNDNINLDESNKNERENMESEIEDNFIVVKLENDDDLFKNIKEVTGKYNIRSGLILTGIGMIKDFELGYFDPEGYKTSSFSEPHELVSMSGSIAFDKNDPNNLLPHIHCAVAGRDHHVFGGHLNKATVNVINEITIVRLNDLILNRLKNETTGLMELNIENRYTY